MYRGVTFAALRRGIDPSDADVVARLAKQVELSVDDGVVLVDTKPPGWERAILDNIEAVTDKSVTRVLAYDTSGLIWDVGLIWRPSRRTAFEAHVGRRYGTTSYYGTFSYAPSDRSSLNVRVYDNVAGFGGQVNRALAAAVPASAGGVSLTSDAAGRRVSVNDAYLEPARGRDGLERDAVRAVLLHAAAAAGRLLRLGPRGLYHVGRAGCACGRRGQLPRRGDRKSVV